MERQIPLLQQLRQHAFQFPSNGKVHGKYVQRGNQCPSAIVSIPFKREGTWKDITQECCLHALLPKFQFPSNGKVHGKKGRTSDNQEKNSFNSLQTGRYMESGVLTVKSEWPCCFNSLQTGRSMESKYCPIVGSGVRVSIPFKREGAWKGSEYQCIHRQNPFEFQFPSNGKEHGKYKNTCRQSAVTRAEFQFPSNGKEHGKRYACDGPPVDNRFVSIPFKREGAWKVDENTGAFGKYTLVSIPFKREGAWKVNADYLNHSLYQTVSIPFKREGAWKVK